MDCSLTDSSVHGILQARILEWVAISYSRGSCWPRDRTLDSCISCTDRRILYHCPTWETHTYTFSSVSSVAQSCPTLCDPMNRSTPGLPVHHQLPEFTQTHVHWVSDAIQPFILCRPLLLLPPIPPSIRVFSDESTLHISGQSPGVSALASFLPKKSQGWSPSEWTS